MPICIIINKRIDFLSPMMIVLKDFHLFLMMIIPLYIHTHTSICSLLIIYIRLLLLSFIHTYIYLSMYVLMNRFLVCTNTKVKINKRININCCYSNAMLSSAQLSTIRRKQHVVSRISVCC
jgi:hypothetical protein